MSRRTIFAFYILVAITFIILVNSVSVNAFVESSDLSYENDDADISNMPYQDLKTTVSDKIDESSNEFSENTENEISQTMKHHREFYSCVTLCYTRQSTGHRPFTKCIETCIFNFRRTALNK
ncbi:16916_t:CDS:1 [Dentiscutata erythropus]|uniref:16916_t:CDS:1 n=1 Tax=Dentiscutata erythropus TaxID=1348616 RepID=A0A9N9G4L7_9GLOM|nr:16916_t:CDS:1 [Dentiscutata erythropus]